MAGPFPTRRCKFQSTGRPKSGSAVSCAQIARALYPPLSGIRLPKRVSHRVSATWLWQRRRVGLVVAGAALLPAGRPRARTAAEDTRRQGRLRTPRGLGVRSLPNPFQLNTDSNAEMGKARREGHSRTAAMRLHCRSVEVAATR